MRGKIRVIWLLRLTDNLLTLHAVRFANAHASPEMYELHQVYFLLTGGTFSKCVVLVELCRIVRRRCTLSAVLLLFKVAQLSRKQKVNIRSSFLGRLSGGVLCEYYPQRIFPYQMTELDEQLDVIDQAIAKYQTILQDFKNCVQTVRAAKAIEAEQQQQAIEKLLLSYAELQRQTPAILNSTRMR